MISTDDVIQQYDLEDVDFNEYSYLDEKGTYIFENEFYECETEILEILLERKIKNSSVI